MSIQLPYDLECFLNAKVQSGRFASSDEAIAEAIRLLREQEDREEARVIAGIRQGLDEMHASKGRPADVVFAEIRQEFQLDPGHACSGSLLFANLQCLKLDKNRKDIKNAKVRRRESRC